VRNIIILLKDYLKRKNSSIIRHCYIFGTNIALCISGHVPEIEKRNK